MADLKELLEQGFSEEQLTVVEQIVNQTAEQVRKSTQARENVIDKKQYEELQNEINNLKDNQLLSNFEEKQQKIIKTLWNEDSYKDLSKEERIKKISEEYGIKEKLQKVDPIKDVLNIVIEKKEEIQKKTIDDIKKYGAKTDDDVVAYAKSLKWE